MEHHHSAQRYRCEDKAALPTIEVAHAPAGQCPALRDDPHVLAMLHFGERNWTDPARPQEFGIGLAPLGNDDDTVEIWRSAAAVQPRSAAGITLQAGDQCAFGHVLVDEAEYGSLTAATRSAYARILQTIRAQGYPHLLRVWHYFPDINGRDESGERYHAFCIGRHQAVAAQREFESDLPAATAIGCRGPGLLIYFIAAATPGVQIENPRQVSAFRYPRQYGPKSPSFSRAMLKSWPQGDALYVSGTASVVGHATRHPHDLDAQLDETIQNLRVVTANAANALSRPMNLVDHLSALKVYLRHGEHGVRAADALNEAFGSQVPVRYLQGDICREDLLLEIEAVCSRPRSGRDAG